MPIIEVNGVIVRLVPASKDDAPDRKHDAEKIEIRF